MMHDETHIKNQGLKAKSQRRRHGGNGCRHNRTGCGHAPLGKRKYIDSEKKIQIVDDVYKIRSVMDSKDTSGNSVTEVYAEAEFYYLTFSVRKEERTFDTEYPETAMRYALSGEKDADLALLASTKECTKSGQQERHE